MMGESAPTGASVGPFSQGVDLHELERLRVLVRFEFDRDLTQDELATALRRCHNNTREAYHLLKEQRRQAQLQATAEMVAAAASSPVTAALSMATPAFNGAMSPAQSAAQATAMATPPSNGKRRSESDGDDAMDGPSKRQRSVGLRTVDLSAEDDDEMLDLTQDTQLMFASPPVDHDQAIALLASVVDRYLLAEDGIDDERWLSGVASALNRQRDPDVDRQLVAAVAALANALSHVAASDVSAVQSDGVKQILEVLVELPRLNQDDVELQLRPSDAELEEQVVIVEKSFALAQSEQLTTSQRAQAARNAITEITKACASCIARQESIVECTKHAQAYRRRVRNRIGELSAIIRVRLDRASGEVATTEREMGEARGIRAQHSRTLMEAINQEKATLMKQGEDELDALMDSHRKIFASTTPAVVQLCRQRDESHVLFTARKDDVIRANTRLEFYQKLEALRQKVAPLTLRWLEISAARVAELKNEAERRVEEKLKMYMAKLGLALHQYYDFHTARQQRAKKACQQEQEKLTEHEEFYDDLVPSAKRDIENKIREYNGVVLHSTQQMREVASSQSELWDGKRKLFSPSLFSAVANEYRHLWEALSGGARDMMSDCVKTIFDQPPAVSPVVSPVMKPVPAPVAPEIKVEPYQFVGRGGDGVIPVMRSAAKTSKSPFVDLTSDAEEDDAMNGTHALDRMEFDNSASRFTRVDDEDTTMPGAAPVVELVSEHKSAAVIQPKDTSGRREFPVGTELYWQVRDEDEESVYVGQVKERKEDGVHVMVTKEGYEYSVPIQYLFTLEEMQAQWPAASQQRERASPDGNCAIM